MPPSKTGPTTFVLVADSSPVQQSTMKEYFNDFQFEDVLIVKDGYEYGSAIKEK